MSRKFDLPKSAFHLPWFIWDKNNKQLITSEAIPEGDITDNKQIVLSETPIPGLNFNPIQSGGGGNRKISFTIPLVKRNNTVGNILLLKQFENLRNQPSGLLGVFKSARQFSPSIKVIFYWGTGTQIPLEWFVAKCDFVHSSGFVNRLGATQFSKITLELWLDETSRLYKAEDTFRKMGALAGQAQSAYNTGRSLLKGSKF